jgi:serine/threonine protein kinase
MSYSTIINPKTNRKVKITSNLGLSILKTYFNQLGGAEEQDLNSCNNKINSKLASGGFKKIYRMNCEKKNWKQESPGLNRQFSTKDCQNSILAITRDSKQVFDKELKIQSIPGSPKIWRYGRCNDLKKYYKIEEKLDMDLLTWLDNRYNNNKYVILIPDDLSLVENFKEKFIDIIHQLQTLHEAGYGHFDIKPENIMIKLKNNSVEIEHLRLIDYGLSDKIPSSKLAGTGGYFDPNTIKRNTDTDVFALGMTLYLALFGPCVIFSDSAQNRSQRISNRTLPLSTETPFEWIERTHKGSHWKKIMAIMFTYPLIVHLLYKMLVITHRGNNRYDSRNRYTLDQVLSHSFWNTDIKNELSSWPNSPEFKEMNAILERRKKREAAKQRHIRNKNRAKYGSSKRGKNCVCIGPCEHQTILACVAGICTNAKKCPVDPNECYGKQFDRC